MHRVLPARAPRLCLTVWVDGAETNAPSSMSIRTPASGVTSAFCADLGPSHRILSRAVYAEEYAESMGACMGEGAALAQMLAAHKAHLEQSAASAPLAKLVALARELKPPPAPKYVATAAVPKAATAAPDHLRAALPAAPTETPAARENAATAPAAAPAAAGDHTERPVEVQLRVRATSGSGVHAMIAARCR